MPITATARAAVAAALVAALVAGCTQQQAAENRVPIGAAAGAAIGAGLGLLVGGNDRRNALVGAGVGALAGAGVGAYLNRTEQALQQDLAGTGATIVNDGSSLLVSLPDGVTFQTGSAQIQPQFQTPLAQVAATLRANPQSYIDVIGHTDNVGSAAFNQRLSEQRAESVADVLRRRGVQPERLVVYGYGLTQPVADNATPEGRARNRRVEIRITPLT